MSKKDELPSLRKLKNDAALSIPLTSLFAPHLVKTATDLHEKVSALEKQIELFTDRFSDRGWCIYDSMKSSVVEKANQTFEKDGIEAAEQVLLGYFKGDVRDVVHCIKNSDSTFMCRYCLIQHCFEEHFQEHYYASVPLALVIIDGAVNDFTRSKGFFADGTNTDVWDCLVGCSSALTKVKAIFTKNRTSTNHEPIMMPYRNGILHGRDTSFDNEYVSCKLIALMFAVADWMKMKKNEEDRKRKFEETANPPPMHELISQIKQNAIDREQIALWKKREISVGNDVPEMAKSEKYCDYPYIIPVIKMLEAWRIKNYGALSIYLEKMFPYDKDVNKRAGSCRALFQHKDLKGCKLVSVKEKGCCMSQVEFYVSWHYDAQQYCGIMRFGVLYQNNENNALPWRNNGTWTLVPWDVRKLYNPDPVIESANN